MRDPVEKLFVYGTLKPGERNHPPIAEHVRTAQPAAIRGILVDRGRSPGLIAGEGIVKGVLLTITAEGLMIADEIEDYHPGRGDSLYIRRRLTATLADESPAPCWTYFFGDPQSVANTPRCVTGRQGADIIYAWPYTAPRFE